MATILSKKELLRAMGTTATGTSREVDGLSRLLQFMNTPVTQEFMRRIMDRWLPPVKSQKGQVKTVPTKEQNTGSKKSGGITGEKVFGLIVSSLANAPDEMTVDQLREWLKQNKKSVVGSVNKALEKGLI